MSADDNKKSRGRKKKEPAPAEEQPATAAIAPEAEAIAPAIAPVQSEVQSDASQEPAPAEERVGVLKPAGVDPSQRRPTLSPPSAPASVFGPGNYRCVRTVRGRARSYIEGRTYFLERNFAPNSFVRIDQ